MNKQKRLFFAFCFILATWAVVKAQQPYGGCWHPDFVENWSPEKDPDAKFNRATISLQPRFESAVKANPNQYKEGKLATCLTLHQMASQAPSQGANNFLGYNPTYWQYMDLVIWWGGSAGEGIFVTPTAPVIDACHQSGVKILANLFFPPAAFGGQAKWVTQVLKQENGKYVFAKKMYDIAKYYGFDGWFINEETVGGQTASWGQLVKEYMEYAQADPTTAGHEIQWYDMGTSISGRQSIVEQTGASMFLDYGSPSYPNIDNQKNLLKTLTNPLTGQMYTDQDCYSKLYFGVEQAQGGLTGNGSAFNILFPTTGHVGSIDIFNPEYPIWKQTVENILETDDDQGENAYYATKLVFEKEARFWVGQANSAGWPDVTATPTRSYYWPGASAGIQERTTIQNKPFISAFSAGMGKYRFVNGEKRGTQDWYHRGMQNILPTWRWWVDATNGGVKTDISFSHNFDDAYNMGTSTLIEGKLNAGADYLIRLYKTKISLSSGDQFQLVFKGVDPSVVSAKLSTTEDGDASFTTFPFTNTSTVNGWTVATVDLSSLNGKKLSVIAINLHAVTAINSLNLELGQLSVFPSNYSPSTPTVSNFSCENAATALTETEGQFRLTWDKPQSEDVSHYNIYMERNGVKSLVGQTRNEGYYIPKFKRSSIAEKNVKLYVYTVNKRYQEGGEQSLEMNYPDMMKPVVTMKVGKTLAKINEEVIFRAKATNFPKSYSWTLPTNCVMVRQSNDSIVVKFTFAGVYSMAVDVTNDIGTTSLAENNCIEINDSKYDDLAKISVGKVIDSASGWLGSEEPKWLIDGVDVPGSINQKWCIGGAKEHWVIIDLKEAYNVYKFVFYDCGNKENYSDNIKNYRILVSIDKETWTELLNETNRPENVKEDWCKPTAARYVKFVPYDTDMPITIRVWEFQVWGLSGAIKLPEMNVSTLGFNETKAQSYSYEMSEAWDTNAATTVTSSNTDIVSVENVVWNKDENKVTFDLLSKQKSGRATISWTLQSGMWKVTKSTTVTVENPNSTLVSAGIIPKVKSIDYYGNWTSWIDMPLLTDGVFTGGSTTYWNLRPFIYGYSAEIKLDLGKFYEVSKIRTVWHPTSDLSNLEKMEVWISDTDQESTAEYAGSILQDGGNFDLVSFLQNNKSSRYFFIKIYAAMPYINLRLVEMELYGVEGTVPPNRTYVPLEITQGLNHDVIAESLPALTSTSVSLDDYENVFYANTVNASGGLPDNRNLISAYTSIPYKLANYSGNNVALLNGTTNNVELKIQPQKGNKLWMLGTSANGQSDVNVRLTYADNSYSDGVVTFGNWSSYSDVGAALYGLSLISRVDNAQDSRTNFRLLENYITLNPAKELTSVSFSNGGTSDPMVFALTIDKNIDTGILDVDNSSAFAYTKGNVLYVYSVQNETVEVYNLLGVKLISQRIIDNLTAISGLTANQIYIVRIGNKIVRIKM